VVIVGGLFAVQFQNRLDNELRLIDQRLKERAISFDFLLKTSADYVDALQLQAQTYYAVNRSPGPPSHLYEHFIASSANGFFNLEQPPEPFTRNMVGAISAPVRTTNPAFQHEVEMALSLNPLFTSIKHNLPHAAWVYYTSKSRFISIYPWTSMQEFRFTRELFTHTFYTRGLPEANPRRERFWTESYVDEAGKGLMVTCAAPVYLGDSFQGTVAIDLTLDVLTQFTGGFNYPHGELFVVNDQNQLLAHPRLVSSTDKAIKTLDAALPPGLSGLAHAIVKAGSGTMTRCDSYYISASGLSHAPWKLVFVAPRLGIALEIIRGPGLLMVALLIGLTVMLAIANRTTRRQFVQPALSLVSHIEKESKAMTSSFPGVPAPIPAVPAAWQPWFETITHIFNEHNQLVSIRKELDVARRIQQSILPIHFPSRDEFQIHACMIPAKEIGGDFYDFFWLDERHLGLVIADVSGKGVPAALFMAVARTLLRAVAPAAASPAACLPEAVFRRSLSPSSGAAA